MIFKEFDDRTTTEVIDPDAYYLLVYDEGNIGPFPSAEAASSYPVPEELEADVVGGGWLEKDCDKFGPVVMVPPAHRPN